MFPSIKNYCEALIGEFQLIPKERKILLEKIASYIHQKKSESELANLIYVCTHNSRRSHFGQIWAAVASDYYALDFVRSFSGGTEATAFHPNAIQALTRLGFEIHSTTSDFNPIYRLIYGESNRSIECFSKIYNHASNPQHQFAAIMTCGEAEQNCPFISGAELRIGTTYEDPKLFDSTPKVKEMYDERCRQIAREVFYSMSKV